MAIPPNFEEGQSAYRPPRFNVRYYGWWKTWMHDFIMAENSELWDVICDGPFVPTKNLGDPAVAIPKTRKELNDADRKAVEKNFRVKKILVCGISPDEYNRISASQSAKEIWEALQIDHEGITQVKQSKIDMLTTEYEPFRMKDDEYIQDMHTRFTSIINELHSLGETIPRNNLVRKILSVLLSSWENKVNAITEAKDLQTLTIDELSINDEDTLTVELGEAEQTRDDLVIVVVDLKETIENFKKEKDALDEKIAHIEHERDDLKVIVVDLKKTFEYVRKEKEALAERVANIKHKRDGLLVVVVDLKETIGEPKIESRLENSQKGKEVSSEAHIKIERELNSVKSSMCAELEKNKQLHEELGRVKGDLEKSLKWTSSSDAITAVYTNNGGNMQGIGFQREKILYNLHSKYVTVPDNWLCTHCGNTRHFKENCKARFQSQQKNKVFAKKVTTGNSERKKPTMNGDLNCLSAIDDDAELWHRRLGHVSFTLLNKLVRKNLVRGLPKSSFKDHKVCDACVKGKHVRSSFKPKWEVSTSRTLDLLHMDLCGPMRVASRGGKKYIFVIVDDYSRFTWTLFLRTN
uniref:GAG-pre-integrase domain-containing protein n=1 Tax=Nicotiana tabacum TaxID=4097 RepID=A0A1S3Z5D1_TOBAC|nr:PREDICTED: uncharacterized protein LOC107783142 [Nicotiana tabacum]